MKWKALDSLDQLSNLFINSSSANYKAIAVFKHSTRCGISRNAKRSLETEWDIPEIEIPLYYLDLLAHRSISNQIEEKLQVRHESPQLILMKNEQCVYHASHHSIIIYEMKKVLSQLE